MRCQACDCLLSDQEATKKSKITGEYYDLCSNCLSYVIDNHEDYSDIINRLEELINETNSS